MFKANYFVLYSYKSDGYERQDSLIYSVGLFDTVRIDKLQKSIANRIGVMPTIVQINRL